MWVGQDTLKDKEAHSRDNKKKKKKKGPALQNLSPLKIGKKPVALCLRPLYTQGEKELAGTIVLSAEMGQPERVEGSRHRDLTKAL